MQLAHFSFGIGAFCSPFIVEPFLKEIGESSPEHAAHSNSTDSGVSKEPLYIDPSTLRIKWAYFIIGAISFLIWITYVVTYLKKRDNKAHPTRESAKVKKSNNSKETVVKLEIVRMDEKTEQIARQPQEAAQPVSKVKTHRPHHKFVMVILSALFIHLAYGLELSFGVMLASYARLSNLHLTKSKASFVTS